MSFRVWIWIVPAGLYAAFFLWYTNLSGPLTPGEVEHYMAVFESRTDDAARLALLRRFMESDTGDDFLMLNMLHLKETPDLVDGVAPGATSEEVMGKYMEFMWPALLARASHPVLFGPAVSNSLDVSGIEDAGVWTGGAAMRYRSRRDMLDISSNPAFSGRHEFKLAALEKTIAYPVEDDLFLTDPRFLLFFVLLSAAGVLNAVLRR
ncbi:MAG: hypothetical protein RLO08_16120 [Parvibaculaceae bacterium]